MRGEIFYDIGELKYSGGTTTDPQTGDVYREGHGIEYFEDGTPKKVGVFQRRGLIYGCEFYPSGRLKSVARYNDPEDGQYYGPSYPVAGTFFDEEGQILYSGPFTISRSGIGWPRVVEPEGYGPLD